MERGEKKIAQNKYYEEKENELYGFSIAD